jgi:hypothetical protein
MSSLEYTLPLDTFWIWGMEGTRPRVDQLRKRSLIGCSLWNPPNWTMTGPTPWLVAPLQLSSGQPFSPEIH